MGFHITISGYSFDKTENPKELTAQLLVATGAISQTRGYITPDKVMDTIPFKLFYEHLIPSGFEAVDIKSIARKIGSTPQALYRYIRKFQEMDILEETENSRIRIRYGDIDKAFMFTKLNIDILTGTYVNAAKFLDDEFREHQYNNYKFNPSYSSRILENFRINLGSRYIETKEPEELLNGLLHSFNIVSDKGSLGKGINTGYSIFRKCFLRHSGRFWKVEEVAAEVGVSPSTVSRFVHKMDAINILEYSPDGAFRLHGGSLHSAVSEIMNFHVSVIFDRYLKVVRLISKELTK